ncbi:hypothetical protein [Streptomyces globisporus]|uniref:hypothetical protein n=1 Tax=Streptomyces globisporus TaxID=1908 RepID=UPI00345F5216|nr:hypothetical protein OG838_23790 [Streptomyces globisporus]
MTTAARPTPAQMPRRRPTPAAPDAPALDPRPAHRKPWERAILASSLPGNFRFVAIALSTHADGRGYFAHQPRVIGLVHDTGLHVGQVRVALAALLNRGFIRQSPADGPIDTADLTLTLPPGALARARRDRQPTR